jgi:P pilus assembly chaperone PapD
MVIMEGRNRETVKLLRHVRACAVFVWMLLFFLAVDLGAGVLVAPTVVILTDKKRTGRINVENPSNKPKEVKISFSYGLPTSDSLGKISIDLRDSDVDDPRSALNWIKAFPRKVLLPPNGSQVIRLVAQPPSDLPDGEYWAHIIIESQEGETSYPLATEEEGITTRLNMIMKTAIALKYRTGDLNAELLMTDVTTKEQDSRVMVLCDLKNLGNVSYLGVLTCRLYDAEDKEISYHKSNLAVYRDLRRGIYLPLSNGDFKRPFRLDLSISGKGRTDVPREDMVFGNEIAYSAVVK